VGLDSSELGHPPEKFARVFARCRALGLHVVAHAGEEGPPAYIWQRAGRAESRAHRPRRAVPARHGPGAAAGRERMPLTVCPLSNQKLRVFPDLARHNLPGLLDAGLCATVNSDDPAYFGGYLNQNLRSVFAATGLTAQHARQLALNSFKASFADAATRRAGASSWTRCSNATACAAAEVRSPDSAARETIPAARSAAVPTAPRLHPSGPCRGTPCTKTSWPRSRPPVFSPPCTRRPSRPRAAAWVYVTPVLDTGWTRQHEQGRLAVQEALGDQVKTSYVDNVAEGADAERVIRDLARQGNDIIFTTSFGYMEPALKVAREFPAVKFESSPA
jgi:hypothetical protein